MFTMKIETENAAFFSADGTTFEPEAEVASLLDVVRDLVLDGMTSGPLHDSNGNAVGEWKLTAR